MSWYVWVLIVVAVLEVSVIVSWSAQQHVRVYGLADAVLALIYLPLFIWALASLAH